MHFDLRELGEDVGDVLELRPVELQVLARREVAVAAVVFPADVRERAQLSRRQQAVRNRDPQHRRVLLDVQAASAAADGRNSSSDSVPSEETARLVAKLRHALGDNPMVEGVVAIHRRLPGSEDTGPPK